MNERRITMMRLIDSKKKFTARELAVRFGVSIRTIQRDLDSLQQIGFPLYTEVGPHGGYRVLPNRIMPPLQLKQYEAFGLFLMIRYLENIPDFPFETIRVHLAEQYYTTLPIDVQETIDQLKNHILFNYNPPFASAPYTTKVLEAALDHKKLKFIYQSQGGSKPFQAFPLGIYNDHGLWYMPAKNNDRITLFRVDRIERLEILEQKDGTLPNLKEWMTTPEKREGIEVHLHFTKTGTRLALSENWLQSISNNEWRGQIPLEEFPFTASKLIKFGPEVKVIAPKQLQLLVIELLEKSISQY